MAGQLSSDDIPPPIGARNVSRTLYATASIQLAGVVSGALVAHLLGPSHRGLLAAIILWPSMVAYVGDLGGPLAYTFLSSRARSNGTSIEDLVSSAVGIATIQSIALVAVGVPITMLALGSYPSVIALAAVYAATYIPLSLLTRYANGLNQGNALFGRFNAVRMVVQFSYVAAVIGIFVVHRPSLTLIVCAAAASNAAALAVAAAPWRDAIASKFRIDMEVLKRVFGYGLRAQIGNLNPMEVLQLDLAVVFLMLGSRSAGLYAIALSMSVALRAAGTSIGMVALPGVALTKKEGPQRRAAIGRAVRLTLLFAAVGAVVLWVVAPVVVPLVFGNAFSDAIPALQVLSVGAALASIKRVLGDCLRGCGEPVAASISEVVGLVVGLILLLVLVPHGGITGAAVAAACCYLGSTITSSFFAWRRAGATPRDLFVPGVDDARLALSVVAEAFRPTLLSRIAAHR